MHSGQLAGQLCYQSILAADLLLGCLQLLLQHCLPVQSGLQPLPQVRGKFLLQVGLAGRLAGWLGLRRRCGAVAWPLAWRLLLLILINPRGTMREKKQAQKSPLAASVAALRKQLQKAEATRSACGWAPSPTP